MKSVRAKAGAVPRRNSLDLHRDSSLRSTFAPPPSFSSLYFAFAIFSLLRAVFAAFAEIEEQPVSSSDSSMMRRRCIFRFIFPFLYGRVMLILGREAPNIISYIAWISIIQPMMIFRGAIEITRAAWKNNRLARASRKYCYKNVGRQSSGRQFFCQINAKSRNPTLGAGREKILMRARRSRLDPSTHISALLQRSRIFHESGAINSGPHVKIHRTFVFIYTGLARARKEEQDDQAKRWRASSDPRGALCGPPNFPYIYEIFEKSYDKARRKYSLIESKVNAWNIAEKLKHYRVSYAT